MRYIYYLTLIFFIAGISAYGQTRYWVGTSVYINNFSAASDLNQWQLIEDSGTGSWTLSGSGSAILKMDNSVGFFANRLFNVNGASPRLLTLDKVNGVVEFQVIAVTGGDQRFFLQAQEFNASGVYITEQNILSPQNSAGYYSVNLSTITWNAATTQVRFIIGGANYSAQQGTIEFNYFNYTNTPKTWSNTLNWSTTSGGASGASAPGAGDIAVFDGVSGKNGICFLDAPVTVAGISTTGYTGTIDLRGFSLTTTGSNTFTSGNFAVTAGNSSLIFNTTGTTTFNGASFNVNISGTTGSLLMNGSTFNGTVSLTKTGSSIDVSDGGNIFSGAVTLNNSGTGTLRLANTTGDTYNGNATFVRTNGTLQPAYNGTNVFAGNISTNSSSAISFGASGGNVTLSGTAAQTIGKTASTASPAFERLIMNKAGGSATLNTLLNIGTSATFTSGILNTTAANYIYFLSGATVSGANALSYVDGPVRKSTALEGFVFPTGDNGIYRSIEISPLGSLTDFTAEYFKASPLYGTNKGAGLAATSDCEYWTLDKNSGLGAPFVTLSWQSNQCSSSYISDPATMRVAHWTGTQWEDLGGFISGTSSLGTVTTGAAVTSFSPFTLGSSSPTNPLPIKLKEFRSEVADGNVLLYWTTSMEKNNNHFDIERSADGISFESIGIAAGKGTTAIEQHYNFKDRAPFQNLSYYRLKQNDVDGKYEYSNILPVYIASHEEHSILRVQPNPATSSDVVYLNRKTSGVLRNVTGYVVKKVTDTNQFDVAGLSPGMYILSDVSGQSAKLVIK
ncbi:MAG TPA: hypothetical protein VIN08_28130 [Ohtaekwangia sp.]|uniref:hypothetical protein n=1 Tax=Ohtaekwangia sp. TaxID=2066019 RepID=UPI002F92F691